MPIPAKDPRREEVMPTHILLPNSQGLLFHAPNPVVTANWTSFMLSTQRSHSTREYLMSTEENKTIAKRVYSTFTEAIRTRNMNLLDQILTPNGIDHNPAPGQGPGIEGVKQTFAGFSIAFPDLEFTVEDQIAEGDRVVSRVKTQGTHKGEFMGIGPTGKRVTATGIDIVRIANGKIVERWGEFDNMAILQQIGALPGPKR